MKTKLLFLYLIIGFSTYGQLAHPYKVKSENGRYFIKSIPFSDQLHTEEGKSIICLTQDSTKIISTINRYFQPDYLFLSNDGNTVCFVLNWFNPGYNPDLDVVFFYKNGTLIKKYQGAEFVDTSINSRIWSLCSYNHEIDSLVDINGNLTKVGFVKGTDSLSMYLNQNNAFVKNDTLFLFTQNRIVNKFNLSTGDIIEKIEFSKYFKNKLYHPKKREIQKYSILIPTQFGLPNLSNGEDYCIAFAKKANLVYCDIGDIGANSKYKQYGINLYCGIDSSGKCVDLNISCSDSLVKRNFIEFINNVEFDKNEIPNGIERWYFRHGCSFRKQSKFVARLEKKREIRQEKREYKLRITKDSIDGIYIPKDLYDCFSQLNKMLLSKEKNEFKTRSEEEACGLSHFGIGLWMRNNWYLWRGSRLSIYFNKLGVKHPDDMSGIIMTSYHRFLNNKELKLKEQINESQEYWKNAKKRKNITKDGKTKYKPPVIVDEVK